VKTENLLRSARG